MKTLLGVLLCSLMFIHSQTLAAQVLRGLGSLSVEATGNMGYSAPNIYTGAGLEAENSRVLGLGRFNFGVTPKSDAGDGTTAAVRMAAYGKLKPLLFGGGAASTWLRTSQYQKHSLRPYLGFGYQRIQQTRFIGNWVFSGNDSLNHLHGALLQLDHYVSPRWQFNGEVGIYRYHPTLHPEAGYRTGIAARFGISFRFWQRGAQER